jgi:hypothetical protein
MRPSLFWDVTQRKSIVSAVSGQPIGPISKDCLTNEDEIDVLSRNVGNQIPIHRLTFQKSEDPRTFYVDNLTVGL